MNDILNIKDNRENIERLIALKGQLVPFIGAGFSYSVCPLWKAFIDKFFENLKTDFMFEEDIAEYSGMLLKAEETGYEVLAHYLLNKAERGKFEREIQKAFDKPIIASMLPKFQKLHRAFPGLKITTNFDCLIEDNGSSSNVQVCLGYEREKLDRQLIHSDQNSLLKIHGTLNEIGSIIFTQEQYASLYGAEKGFKEDAEFPAFMQDLFKTSSIVFIGCSLVYDRVIEIMEKLRDMKAHFAIMRLPKDKYGKIIQKELVLLNRRLSRAKILPVWINEFAQIETLLSALAPEENKKIIVPPPHVIKKEPVLFVGREKPLEEIEKEITKKRGNIQMITGRLFNIEGAGGIGKTTLALEAATKYGSLFRNGVLEPFRADAFSPMSFAKELATRMNLEINEPKDKEEAKAYVSHLLKEKEYLVILDNVVEWEDLVYMVPEKTLSTILITTRSKEMADRLRIHCSQLPLHEIKLETFSPNEVLALFNRMLGSKYRSADEPVYQEIASSLGYLPIALRQVISLMLYGPHYTALQLKEKLKNEKCLELLKRGVEAEGTDCRTIEAVFDLSSELLTSELKEALALLAVCSPGPVSFSFLQKINEKLLDKEDKPVEKEIDLEEALERLVSFSWIEPRLKGEEKAFEMHQLVRELVREKSGNPYKVVFLDVVHEMFTSKSVHFSQKDEIFSQLEQGFAYAIENKDERLKSWLYDLVHYCTYRGYGHFYVRLTESVEQLFPEDRRALSICYINRGLIFYNWGKLDQAMELLKKQEELCIELGDRAGLSRTFGNQGVILYLQGKLDQAMELEKKRESICEELGDRAGLSKSYGNQALILQDWGKLDEAMELEKKRESICEELGDRAGLSKSYCAQGLIFRNRGDLDQAMLLYKKEEAICVELGDRAGLARTWWNQGSIYKEKGDHETHIALWKKSIETNKAIGIPTEKYEKALEPFKGQREKGEEGRKKKKRKRASFGFWVGAGFAHE